MSRSKKGKKAAGHEYWSRRPMSNRHGALPGRDTKKLTHRKERQAGNREIRKDDA